MAEKLQETRKLDFRDFTLCTSMGALCYLIAITLGSGSFHDMMYDWVGVIVQLLLLQTLALMTGGFLIYLTEYTSDKLNLGPPKNFELSWLKKNCWRLLIAAIALFALALVIQIIHLILQAKPYKLVNDLTLYLALFSGICGSIFIMAHMFYEIMKEPRTWAFMIVFGFVASMIWLNAYRDAQKSALIADSEYCHWLGSSNPGAKDFPPDPACERLREDNIIYSRYLTEDAG